MLCICSGVLYLHQKFLSFLSFPSEMTGCIHAAGCVEWVQRNQSKFRTEQTTPGKVSGEEFSLFGKLIHVVPTITHPPSPTPPPHTHTHSLRPAPRGDLHELTAFPIAALGFRSHMLLKNHPTFPSPLPPRPGSQGADSLY